MNERSELVFKNIFLEELSHEIKMGYKKRREDGQSIWLGKEPLMILTFLNVQSSFTHFFII
jgi:hypothetical protein